MARAVAGNQVQVSPGLYLGSPTPMPERQDAFFMPANSGTLGNEIAFFAEHPAATNYGSTSLYSELREQVSGDQDNGATLGTGGQDYVIFDGFYLDEFYNIPQGNGGIVNAFGESYFCEFRRLAFDRYDRSYVGNYNANCIYMDGTNNHKVLDCRFEGAIPNSANHNNASINIYNSGDYLIQNCYFGNNTNGIYSKENFIQPSTDPPPDFRNSGTVRYCHFYQGGIGFEVQQGNTIDVEYNLFEDNDPLFAASLMLDSGPDRIGELTWRFQHNTIILPGGADIGFFMKDVLGGLTNCVWRDNIVYSPSAMSSGYFVTTSAWDSGSITQWTWADWTIDYNCYYAPTALRWYGDALGELVTSLADWRTETGQEANSIDSDPEFVGGGDYRLANNAQAALTASSTGGPVGCYVTGSEEIGIR